MAKNIWAQNCLNTILLASVFLSFFNRCLQKSVLNTFKSAVSASQVFIMKITLIGVSYNQEKHPLSFCFLARGEIFHSKQNIERGGCSKDFENWANHSIFFFCAFLFLFDTKAKSNQNSAELNEKKVTEQFWGNSWYPSLFTGHPVHQSLFKGNF